MPGRRSCAICIQKLAYAYKALTKQGIDYNEETYMPKMYPGKAVFCFHDQ